jgi:hypothetical protein
MTNKLKSRILKEMQLYEKKIVKQKTKDERAVIMNLITLH